MKTAALLCSVSLSLCLLLAGIVPAYGANATTEGMSAQDMLQRFAQHAASMRTLQVSFRQEKYLALLDDTLRAKGRMCVARTPEQGNASGSDTLLWEYTEPEISGFFLDQDGLRVWLRSRSTLRSATKEESFALGGLSSQVLAWIRADTKHLQKNYRLESVPPHAAQGAPSAQQDASPQPGLRFIPLRPGFFSAIEVHFSPDFTRLTSLRLIEEGGDDTLLLFDTEQRDLPLASFCTP